MFSLVLFYCEVAWVLDWVFFHETGTSLQTTYPFVNQSSGDFKVLFLFFCFFFNGLVRRQCLDLGSETPHNN